MRNLVIDTSHLDDLSEIRLVMQFIDKQSIAAGLTPRDTITQIEANSCYHCAEPAIKRIVPQDTPNGRPRNFRRLMVTTIVKYIRSQQH
jgi:hypothetical protein